MRFVPYQYQKQAMSWIGEHPRCCLFLDMGLGKTVITLTAIQRLIDDAELSKVLVVAPKKVAESTWATENSKWDHLGLKVSVVLGSAARRVKALSDDADVYVTGRDNFVWMVDYYRSSLPFDAIVLDELTSFKSNTSQRFKALRRVAPSFRRVIGLTGTPAPNGLIDLWAQMYVIDGGERLGKSLTRYRDTYFSIHKWNNIIIRCTPKAGMEKVIRERISDICLSMQGRDYLQLPDMIVHDYPVDLGDAYEGYERFEREEVLSFEEDDTNIIASNAAGLLNKLQQYASGMVYDSEHNVHVVHTRKGECLREIVEGAMASECHVLVFYAYVAEIPMIADALKGFKVRNYTGAKDLDDWNAGKIEVLLAHPASTAYGLNMQQGGHYIVWYGLTWNLELYQQANARLHRQGQPYPVQVYRLIASGTVDERICQALSGKGTTQERLLSALSDLRRFYEQDNNNVSQDDDK